MNNLRNINSTELSPNKIICGFWTKEAMDLLPYDKQAADEPTNLETYQPLWVDAKDAIAFAQMRIKDYYNCRHALRFFKVGDMLNLRLHRAYTFQGITNNKRSQQFVEPLKVLKQIERLTYRLKVSVV